VSAETTPALRFEDLEVLAGDLRILGPVSLQIERGESWVLLGPNGSGKTTLLRVAGARRQPSRGQADVLGATLGSVDVRTLWPRIGHFSHALADRLRPEFTCLQIVLTGRDAALVPYFATFTGADADRARALLDEAGCGDLADRHFGDCSLGERQRVLIARARFGRPELLLLDEPAAGMDLPGREALVGAVERTGDDGATVILATHHLEEIPANASHAALLRGGLLVAAGPIDEVLEPARCEACFGITIFPARTDGGRWTMK
jgi:iron complex transport system ATP-binding protein